MLAEKTPESVLVVSGTAKIIEYLSELLPASSFSPIVSAGSCGEAKRLMMSSSFDIVFINAPLSDEFGIEFALDIAQCTASSVILFVKIEVYDDVSGKVESSGVLTIPKPNTKAMVYQTMKIASAVRARFRMLEKKNETLTTKMGEIKIVNRAKWILIKYLNMTEADAHRFIEKQAMDMRLTKREIAENIITTYEN
ncbi:MAG: ANTAR domain-containing response regulator [Oscillospiraceae bacterium]